MLASYSIATLASRLEALEGHWDSLPHDLRPLPSSLPCALFSTHKLAAFASRLEALEGHCNEVCMSCVIHLSPLLFKLNKILVIAKDNEFLVSVIILKVFVSIYNAVIGIFVR